MCAAAPTGIFIFDLLGVALFEYEAVIVEQFLAGLDVAQRFDEHPLPVMGLLQAGLAIWFAGVVDPSGRVAGAVAVDD